MMTFTEPGCWSCQGASGLYVLGLHSHTPHSQWEVGGQGGKQVLLLEIKNYIMAKVQINDKSVF